MSVVPGPCPPGGCPPYTEIDCIHVDKVYDYCFEADTIQPQICVTIKCTGSIVSATCSVSTVDCTWLMNSPSATAGYAISTFLITGTVDFTLTCTGSTKTESQPFSLTKSILLCAPDGTTQSCEVLTAICTPPVAIPVNGGDDKTCYNLCTTIGICSTFQSEANVKIMVPSYGFCAPAPCEVSPLILPCPPSSLFPPQCT